MRTWKPGDEAAFTPRQDFAAEMTENAHDWSAGPPGPTWTLYRWSGEIVGIGGGVLVKPSFKPERERWDLWACLAPLARRDWPQALWHAGRVMNMLATEGPRRFWATVNMETRGGVGTLQRLGFEWIGTEARGNLGRYHIMERRG